MRILQASWPLSVVLAATSCAGLPYVLTQNRDTLVAVDVALDAEATLGGRTTAGNSHVTLVRSFIRSSDLHHLSAAVAGVMSTTALESLNLKATGSRSAVWNGIAGTAIVVDPSPELRRLEERMVETMRPFAVNPEDAKSFIVTPDGAPMSGAVINAVDRFVPDSSGLNYRPHVAAGSAQADSQNRSGGQPSEGFTFKPTGASVYQIGQSGTAQRTLWTWTGEMGAR